MISVRQYEKVLGAMKGSRREEILVKYYNDSPYYDTTEIAKILDYPNINAVNLQLGSIGRFISTQTGIPPKESYEIRGEIRPSYFLLLHDYYENGWELHTNLEKAMANLGLVKPGKKKSQYFNLKTEEKEYWEGKSIRVIVNCFERKKGLRDECLKFYKQQRCIGCGADFKKKYGLDIPDIIEVHHLIPLGKIRREYKCDPKKDLVPLCPNCHAVVHSTNPLMTIAELKKRVRKR